ncbi:unnamed protein product [Aspergillus oryzae var. brunneus]|uniref:Unnamed protein product n=1 Tax=Aspergillus oryzae var. brunneus TaxID=332754 RepID=A0ABQ6L5F6_ASPOZ|nr:unnamed protein product [Aspergillus oryzae var. brunneus]
MSDAPAPVAEGSASRPRPSRRGGRGRGNRNHRRPQTQAPERSHDAQAAQPPTQQPSQVQPTQNSPSDLPADAPRSRRGPRRGRGGGRGGGAPSEGSSRRQRQRGGDRGTTSTGRRFEGRLTKPEQAPEGEQVDTAVDANDLGLRADAPAFVPGTQSEPVANEPTPSTTSAPAKKKPKAKNAPPPPPKVTTKSVAPDIATRIHEDIAHNLYECPICTAELGRRSRVWNCGLCWTVFHLSCVKKWSKNEGAAAQDSARRQGEGDPTTPRAWRCPGSICCTMRTARLRIGLVVLVAETNAIAPSTVAFTSARRVAIHRTYNPPTVQGHQTSSFIVLAVKHHWRKFPDIRLETLVRTPFPTAWRPVERFYRVDIHATRSATPDLVGLVCAESSYLAVADATHLCQFATKVLLSTLSVFASARLACIVVGMRVLSAVVPANRRRLSVRLCGESSSLISAQVMKMWRPNISALGCVAAC